MADDLDKTIRDSAAGPAKATVDGVSMEQHKLTDVIAVRKHLGAADAMNSPTFGLRIAKIIAPGASGRRGC
jgi:hypothetical protein